MYKYEIVYVFFFLYFLFFENAYPCMQMTSTTLQRQNHARRRVLIRKALLQVGVQHVPESVHDGRVTVTAVLLHEQTFDIPRPRALVGQIVAPAHLESANFRECREEVDTLLPLVLAFTSLTRPRG